jgi:hypothetical protein
MVLFTLVLSHFYRNGAEFVEHLFLVAQWPPLIEICPHRMPHGYPARDMQTFADDLRTGHRHRDKRALSHAGFIGKIIVRRSFDHRLRVRVWEPRIARGSIHHQNFLQAGESGRRDCGQHPVRYPWSASGGFEVAVLVSLGPAGFEPATS